MNVAVVRNRSRDGVIARYGAPSPETYGRKSVQRVLDALRRGGHRVACLEADTTLFAELESFLGPELGSDEPAGLVLNMGYGIQGECRYTHLPAMLEMAGVPYTGATPLGHAVSLDKVVAKVLMRDAGVPTPAWKVMSAPGELAGPLRFPLIVKPRHESTSCGLQLVHTPPALDAAVAATVAAYRQEALVEEYVDGREICIGLLGNDPPVPLPPVELDFAGRPLRLVTFDDKYHRSFNEPTKTCPAPLAPATLAALEAIAVATFEACHCRDYARVDIRLDPAGRPYVLEINSMASLGAGGSFVRAAEVAGLPFDALVERIVTIAWERSLRSHVSLGDGEETAPTPAAPASVYDLDAERARIAARGSVATPLP
jgi:D-alanine-D-alanine ligase